MKFLLPVGPKDYILQNIKTLLINVFHTMIRIVIEVTNKII